MCLKSFLNFLISYSVKGYHGDFTVVILLPIIENSNVKYFIFPNTFSKYPIFSYCNIAKPQTNSEKSKCHEERLSLHHYVCFDTSKQELSAYKQR